ncbi:MAG: putative glycerol-3-phosphate acyltransferase [candidate division WS2 bacterium]|nr:putative glycerol-3-phosphate acyltransferase [Candidatus Psychracetigena formicireducens]
MFIDIILVIFSYLLGSVLFGVVGSKFLKGEDIRGKDNPGGSGSIRQYGWAWGISVGILDALKGVLVGYLVTQYATTNLTLILCGIGVVAGHNWPVYFGFRGGGGLAPTFGLSLFLFPRELLISAVPALLSAPLYFYTKLPKYLPFVGPAPIMGAFAVLTLLVLVILGKGFYPYAILILAMGITLIIRGYTMYLRDKKRRKELKS